MTGATLAIAQIEATSVRITERTTWMFLRLTTDDGVWGIGEFSDGGTLDEVRRALVEAKSIVFDSKSDIGGPSLAQRMAMWRDRAPTRSRRRAAATVLSAVDQAIADISATVEGLPVWRWLGGASRTTPLMAVYANINRAVTNPSPEATAELAARAVAAGFRAVKCAPFDQDPLRGYDVIASGLRRVREVRQAIGPDVKLMVDAHHHVPPDRLSEVARRLEQAHPYWLEDAVDIEDLGELARLARLTSIPLAGGEETYGLPDIAKALDTGLLDVVMPDVKHAGGVTGALAIARAAGDTAVSLHNPTGPIATAASLHVAATCPNFTILELAYGEVSWSEWFPYGSQSLVDGILPTPDGPGLGICTLPSLPRFRDVGGQWWGG